VKNSKNALVKINFFSKDKYFTDIYLINICKNFECRRMTASWVTREEVVPKPTGTWNQIGKELSLCHKLGFVHPYIL